MQPKDALGPSRAKNTSPLGILGDPERWGGAASLKLHLIGGAGQSIAHTPQIIRVQSEDLVARAWDVSCKWDVEKSVALPLASGSLLGLEINYGAGQATATGSILLLSQAPFALGPTIVLVEGEWIQANLANATPNGATQAKVPIPAAALAIRGVLVAAADADMDLTANFVVTVSPRALTG